MVQRYLQAQDAAPLKGDGLRRWPPGSGTCEPWHAGAETKCRRFANLALPGRPNGPTDRRQPDRSTAQRVDRSAGDARAPPGARRRPRLRLWRKSCSAELKGSPRRRMEQPPEAAPTLSPAVALPAPATRTLCADRPDRPHARPPGGPPLLFPSRGCARRGRSEADPGPRLGPDIWASWDQICSESSQLWPKSVKHRQPWSNFGQTWPRLDRTCQSLDTLGPNLAEVGPSSVELGQMVARIEPTSTEVANMFLNPGRVSPKPGRVRTNSPKCDRNLVPREPTGVA